MNPTQWSKYRAKVSLRPTVAHPKLNVFAARYSLAKGYAASHFEGVSVATSESYSAALHVGLAYTALEALESALGAGRQIRVVDDVLCAEFRAPAQVRMMETLLKDRVTARELRGELRAFSIGDDDNLRPIAYALRNLMFHGALTAASLTLDSSKSRRRLLHSLAGSVLDAADLRFTAYVQRLK